MQVKKTHLYHHLNNSYLQVVFHVESIIFYKNYLLTNIYLMCFSKESSIISYLVGLIPSYLLLISDNKYNKHIGLISLVFIQIQLAEFLMWSDINCKNKLNHYGSKFAHIILSLQPLSLLIGAYYFKTTTIDQKLLLALTLIYTIPFFIIIHHQFFKNALQN